MQGLHWIHVRSLPVSVMASCSTGGVPTLIFIRYSYPTRPIGPTKAFVDVECKAAVNQDFLDMERSNACLRRWKRVMEGSYEGEWRESRWKKSRVMPLEDSTEHVNVKQRE